MDDILSHRISVPGIRLFFTLSLLTFALCASVSPPAAFAATSKGMSHAATTQTAWPMLGMNAQHTNYNSQEKAISTSNVSRLKLKWTISTARIESQVTVVGSVLYVYDSSAVRALNATTGVQKWSTEVGFINASETVPLVVNGYVYVNVETVGVVALNALSGKIVWTSPANTASYYSAPSYDHGIVYVGGNSDTVYGAAYGLDAKTGKILRAFNTGPYESAISSPTIANGIIYFRTLNTVQAFNLVTGAKLWLIKTHQGVGGSGVTVADGLAFYGANDQSGNLELHALDAKTGVQKWSVTRPGAFTVSIAIANGVVYSKMGSIMAYNETTGKRIWTASAGIDSSPSTGIVLANGLVFSGSYSTDTIHSSVRAFDAKTGALRWSYTTKTIAFYSPIVANGMLYIGEDDRKLDGFGLS